MYGLSLEGSTDIANLAEPLESDFWNLASKKNQVMSGGIKKNQLKDEFQQMADLVAKVLENCTFSLDSVPLKRYHVMIAIFYGLKINWANFIWYVLAYHKVRGQTLHRIFLSHLLVNLGCAVTNGKDVHKAKELITYDPVKTGRSKEPAAVPEKKQQKRKASEPKVPADKSKKSKTTVQTAKPAVETRTVVSKKKDAVNSIIDETVKEIDEMSANSSPERTVSAEPPAENVAKRTRSALKDTATSTAHVLHTKKTIRKRMTFIGEEKELSELVRKSPPSAERPVGSTEKSAEVKPTDQMKQTSTPTAEVAERQKDPEVQIIEPIAAAPVAIAPPESTAVAPVVESRNARRKRTGKAKVSAYHKKKREEAEQRKRDEAELKRALEASKKEADVKNMTEAELAAKEEADLAKALEDSKYGPRRSEGIVIGERPKEGQYILPKAEPIKKKRSEVRRALQIVQSDSTAFKRFEAELERMNQLLQSRTTFLPEKIRYNRWREYRLTKSEEEIEAWKEFAAEGRWVLSWLQTTSVTKALDSEFVKDRLHDYAKVIVLEEATAIKNSIPNKPGPADDRIDRAVKIAVYTTLEKWAERSRFEPGTSSTTPTLPSLQQIAYGSDISTYQEKLSIQQTTSPFVPADLIRQKTVVSADGTEIIHIADELASEEQKKDQQAEEINLDTSKKLPAMEEEPAECQQEEEPAESSHPAPTADLHSSLMESIQLLFETSMKEMESRNKLMIQQMQEETAKMVKDAIEDFPLPPDNSLMLTQSILNLSRNIEDVKADVGHLHSALQRHESGIAGIRRVMKQVGEAEMEKNIAMMQELTAVADKAHSEISTLQLNVDCLNDKAGELKSNQLRMEAAQLRMETTLNHHCAEQQILDKNIKKLCAAVNITPDQLNPAADDKKGEEESAEKTIAAATIQVRDQRAAAGKPSEEEVLEEEADDEAGDKVELKDVAKTDKELAASKYSAEEQLNPDVKYKRLEDIRARFEAEERREKLKGLADAFSSGEDEESSEEAFQAAWQATCKVRGGVMLVPSGTFLLQPITFYGNNCQGNFTWQVNGEIVAPPNISGWKGIGVQWILFSGFSNGITIRGNGVIDGRGNAWWGKSGNAPHAIRIAKSNKVTVTGIKIQNSPRMHIFFEECQQVTIFGLTIASPQESPNTDGIHITHSQHVEIYNSTIGCGDDCVSIQTESSDVRIHNVHCQPGHGYSIGGLGPNNQEAHVTNVHVYDSSVADALTGVRIKTWPGGSGYANNITFSHITMTNVKTPIVIDQDYCNGKKGCVSVSTMQKYTNGHNKLDTLTWEWDTTGSPWVTNMSKCL
ncbi:hypothetical protein RD792_016600 [Penstemon davidsonii]|uniref:Polygalacturonase n=1 Tax=Penstemon davidsonii TaxID=160366 RepID=A0ABR0CJT4_9LAMI|nr:hypothetical protein RD792_016600 [Penstemon davidsonii]